MPIYYKHATHGCIATFGLYPKVRDLPLILSVVVEAFHFKDEVKSLLFEI